MRAEGESGAAMTDALAGTVVTPASEGTGAAVARAFPLPALWRWLWASSWVVGARAPQGVE